MEYWREDSASTATPPALASDVVGQPNEIGSIAFGAALEFIVFEKVGGKSTRLRCINHFD